MSKENVFRSLAVLIGAVAQVFFGALPFVKGWSENVATRSDAVPTLITPANFAFGIWNVLFVGCALFAVYHLFWQTRPSAQRIGWLAAAAFWGNALWEIIVPLDGFGIASVVVIVAIWLSLVALMRRAQSDDRAEIIDRVARAPLFALAGWVTAAMFVNILVAATAMDIPWLGSRELAPALLVLGIATLTTAWLSWRTGSVLFAASFAWGLFAIRAASQSDGVQTVATLALVAAGIVALGLVAGGVRRLRRA